MEKFDNEKEKRPRTVGGSIIRKPKTIKTRRGTKEVVELFARVRRKDADGKWRDKTRKIFSEREAAQAWRDLEDEFERERQKALQPPAEQTFDELVEYYEKNYVKEATWRGNQKIDGFRNPLQNLRRELKILKEFFGGKPLAEISYDDLREFRNQRLATPVANKPRKNEHENEARPLKERKVASVNRELARLRVLMNLAVKRGWLEISPFRRGDSLISQAAEEERMRILTRAEEKRLLDACDKDLDPETGKERRQSYKRAHLKPILICALDTALRQSEILKLTWKNVDFKNGVIFAEGKNTKTLKQRIVPITKRLRAELLRLWEMSQKKQSARVFQFKEIKRSFATACDIAGITDFRFHDLRHTAITKMLEAGASPAQVMKISGHTQMKTFLRYTNTNAEIAQSIAAALDALEQGGEEKNRSPLESPRVVNLRQFVAKKS